MTQASRGRNSARGSAQAKAYGSPRGSTRRGFSLIELMIAIVILGLGMVLVATMFPVAWGRARMLAEFTSQKAVTDAAEATVKLLARVDGAGSNGGSFAGDLIFSFPDVDPTFPLGGVVRFSDTRVHALHLENLNASNPLAFTWEKLWRCEFVVGNLDWGDPPEDPVDLPASYYDVLFLWPQVRFESRVYPPLPQKQDATQTYSPAGYQGYRMFSDPGKEPDRAWEDMLATRRFCWAVFHRLREPVGASASSAAEAIPSSRTFDMYYVTLRRPHPTNRYARQDPDLALIPDPDPSMREVPAQVQALGPEEDLLLPVPWRVQILLPDDLYDAPLGVPTEVSVGETVDVPTVALLAELFRRGTPFIDELTGKVYEVTKRRLTGDNDNVVAHLTLDTQIPGEDVDDGEFPGNWALELDERLRAVWVFPPPVRAARGPDDTPIFEGSQPVVGIEIRTRVVSPFD